MLGVWRVVCAPDGMGVEGGRMDAPFYTFAYEIGCNHAADQGAGAGLFPIRMAGGYWWKRAEVPDATVLSAFP